MHTTTRTTGLMTLLAITALTGGLMFTSCDKGDKDDGGAEKLGAKIDAAAEDLSEQDAKDDAKDGVNNPTDDIKDAANDIEEGVKDAANDIEDKIDGDSKE